MRYGGYMNRSIFSLALAVSLFSFLEALQVGGLTYLETLKPGDSVKVQIPLISDRDKNEVIDFNLSDYSADAEGHHFFTELGQNPRGNGKWITLSSHREIIAPGEKKELTLTIDVPNDSSLDGSYWSVLLIEPTDPIQTLKEPEHGFQLQVKVRYAYHIVVNLGKGTPSLKIVKKELQEVGGKKWLAVDVENKGTLFFKPQDGG